MEAKEAAARNARVGSGDARRRQQTRPPTRGQEVTAAPFSRAASSAAGAPADYNEAARQAYLDSRLAARRNAHQAAVELGTAAASDPVGPVPAPAASGASASVTHSRHPASSDDPGLSHGSAKKKKKKR
jgi:hypothetical protein